MLDLKNLQPSDQAVEIPILHPTSGESLGISIFVFGSDSSAYRKASSDLQTKRLARLGPAKMRLTAAEIEEDTLDLLAHCTDSWKGVTYDGKELKCTHDEAKKLYRELPWLREQIDRAISDRANFIQASMSS